MRLKRCFVMFVTVCLIFSVSWAPCYASNDLSPFFDSAVNLNNQYNGMVSIPDSLNGTNAVYGYATVDLGTPYSYTDYLSLSGWVYATPIVGSLLATGSSVAAGGSLSGAPSFSFVPESAIDYDISIYFSFGAAWHEGYFTSSGSPNAWNFKYFDDQAVGVVGDNVGTNSSYASVSYLGSHGSNGLFKFDVDGDPWNNSSDITEIRIDTFNSSERLLRQISFQPVDVRWSFSGPAGYRYGFYIPYCFAIRTNSYLDIFDEIYSSLVSIDSRLAGQLPQIYSALQNIVTQLEALNTDTDTIIEILNQIKNLDQQQLSVLNYILTSTQSLDTTVKQIYALMLSEVDGSDELSSEASSATGSINNNDVQEVHWQTSMSYNFDQLQLGNYNLNLLGSGLALVGNMFSSIWSAFGQWSIVFTFPLILGIALLVIGRLSKTGGGNSSRNSEHKGGEGGA